MSRRFLYFRRASKFRFPTAARKRIILTGRLLIARKLLTCRSAAASSAVTYHPVRSAVADRLASARILRNRWKARADARFPAPWRSTNADRAEKHTKSASASCPSFPMQRALSVWSRCSGSSAFTPARDNFTSRTMKISSITKSPKTARSWRKESPKPVQCRSPAAGTVYATRNEK